MLWGTEESSWDEQDGQTDNTSMKMPPGAEPLVHAACLSPLQPIPWAIPVNRVTKGPCNQVIHSLKCHAESPLASRKVAFSRAALRRQTAGSACTKWYPSAQKHFRVRNNTVQAYHGTFKPPLYRRGCVLRRDHKIIRPRGMCTLQHKHACLDALLSLLRTFFFYSTCGFALWYLQVTHTHTSLTL